MNLEGTRLGKYEIRVALQNYYAWEAQLDLDRAGERPLFVRLIPMEDAGNRVIGGTK